MASLSDKPFSQSCENNKHAILTQLKRYFSNVNKVLEIGSGTGQHAVFFAQCLNHLKWYCADQPNYHEAINAWINDYPCANLYRPVALSFPDDELPYMNIDGIFTANTAHIMHKHQVQNMMGKISDGLVVKGVFCQYGPFIIDGKFSSQSNEDFHHHLLAVGCGGYKSIEELQMWAPKLVLDEIIQMPANNLMLVWHKR